MKKGLIGLDDKENKQVIQARYVKYAMQNKHNNQ